MPTTEIAGLKQNFTPKEPVHNGSKWIVVRSFGPDFERARAAEDFFNQRTARRGIKGIEYGVFQSYESFPGGRGENHILVRRCITQR